MVAVCACATGQAGSANATPANPESGELKTKAAQLSHVACMHGLTPAVRHHLIRVTMVRVSVCALHSLCQREKLAGAHDMIVAIAAMHASLANMSKAQAYGFSGQSHHISHKLRCSNKLPQCQVITLHFYRTWGISKSISWRITSALSLPRPRCTLMALPSPCQYRMAVRWHSPLFQLQQRVSICICICICMKSIACGMRCPYSVWYIWHSGHGCSTLRHAMICTAVGLVLIREPSAACQTCSVIWRISMLNVMSMRFAWICR